MKKALLLFAVLFHISGLQAQLKFLIEDFEGLPSGISNLNMDGLFTFGSATHNIENMDSGSKGYTGQRSIKFNWNFSEPYGGWGKGIGVFVDLSPKEDYLNFFVLNPKSNKRREEVKIILEEDDNGTGKFENKSDDSWYHNLSISSSDEWQLISIPIYQFKDSNTGGDGKFNVNHKQGKLLTFIVSFLNSEAIRKDDFWQFDFICFSKGKLNHGATVTGFPAASVSDYCLLGAWSEEGKGGDFSIIPNRFEEKFNGTRKLDIVHFFQPFSVSEGHLKSNLLSSKELNDLIKRGYTPMITLENRFVNVNENYKQPDLKNILEGHFDYLFLKWAKSVKEVDGTVWIRILHEFNGDWYPWSISNNNKNPQTYIQTYRHIYDIFKKEGASNARFIWCPNSMSIPQASWNYIMDAYPGDEYVDYVGLDIYNGAGEDAKPLWRSFRKEAAQNYYTLTTTVPQKPLLICETASRERSWEGAGEMQSKADWINQMSEALQNDMSKFRAVIWFNEKETFKVNSSESSFRAFAKTIWNNPYFGKKEFVNGIIK